MEESLRTMRLADVARRCSEELGKPSHHLQSDERFCLELFRRALIDNDNDAWEALQNQFRERIALWFRLHPYCSEALEIEPERNYVDDTFTRLWIWAHNQRAKFNGLAGFNDQAGFNSLPGALRFLHDCLDTQVRDIMRSHRQRQMLSLIDVDVSIPFPGEDDVFWQEVWEKIRLLLPNDREYRIIYLTYHDGLKPRQIPQLYPDEFPDIKEVRRPMKNAMERLRNHKGSLQGLLGNDDPMT